MLKNFNALDGLEMAKKCVSLDPTVADFHRLLGSLHGFAGDFVSSNRCIERALELNPTPEWLYARATSLRLQSERDPAQVIKAYEDYISANEPDSRKVPEAYYCIGLEYQNLNNEEKAEEFLKKAIESESPPVRLSYFGPIEDDFPPKFYLKTMKMLKKIGVINPGNRIRQNDDVSEM
jgi:tetratricopeptide (TPR) repeat protein